MKRSFSLLKRSVVAFVALAFMLPAHNFYDLFRVKTVSHSPQRVGGDEQLERWRGVEGMDVLWVFSLLRVGEKWNF